MTDSLKHSPLRLCVCIVNADKKKAVAELFSQAHIGMRFQFKAQGTASSDILDVLGIGETEKAVIMGLAPKNVTQRVFDVLKMELQLSKAGRGIAFTMPISGISNVMYKMLDPKVRQELQERLEREVKKMKTEAQHHMILSVVNLGYTEELMDAARDAGARGGTVIHARRLGDKDQLKFWGIALQEEREIVGILCPRCERKEIMKAISLKCGMNTPAQGVIFSLPVDEVAGIETPTFSEDCEEE